MISFLRTYVVGDRIMNQSTSATSPRRTCRQEAIYRVEGKISLENKIKEEESRHEFYDDIDLVY